MDVDWPQLLRNSTSKFFKGSIDRVATHHLNTEPAVKINMSFTLDMFCDEVIKDLKKNGELSQQD